MNRSSGFGAGQNAPGRGMSSVAGSFFIVASFLAAHPNYRRDAERSVRAFPDERRARFRILSGFPMAWMTDGKALLSLRLSNLGGNPPASVPGATIAGLFAYPGDR